MAKVSTWKDGMKKINIRHFSVDDVGFFEGPEKLLEVWFNLGVAQLHVADTDEKMHNGVNNASGLRIIPKYVCYILNCRGSLSVYVFLLYRSKWKDILNLVHCEIITSCHGEGLDAYLLR